MTTLQDAMRTSGITEGESNQPETKPESNTAKARPVAVKRASSEPRNIVHHRYINSWWEGVERIFLSIFNRDRAKDVLATAVAALDPYALLPTYGALRNPKGIKGVVLIAPTLTGKLIKSGRHIRKATKAEAEAMAEPASFKVADAWKVGLNVQRFASMMAGHARTPADLLLDGLIARITIHHVDTDGQAGRTKAWQGTAGIFGLRGTMVGESERWAEGNVHIDGHSESGRATLEAIKREAEKLGPVPADLLIDYQGILAAEQEKGRSAYNELQVRSGECLKAEPKCPFATGKVRLSKAQGELLRKTKGAKMVCPIHGAPLSTVKTPQSQPEAKAARVAARAKASNRKPSAPAPAAQQEQQK